MFYIQIPVYQLIIFKYIEFLSLQIYYIILNQVFSMLLSPQIVSIHAVNQLDQYSPRTQIYSDILSETNCILNLNIDTLTLFLILSTVYY